MTLSTSGWLRHSHAGSQTGATTKARPRKVENDTTNLIIPSSRAFPFRPSRCDENIRVEANVFNGVEDERRKVSSNAKELRLVRT